MAFNLTPRRVRRFGWKPQHPDARDLKFKVPTRRRKLPDVDDVREFMPSVLDQGNLGTCVPHGVTEAERFAMRKEGLPDVPLARLQLYVDARKLEGTPLTEDSGLEIRDAIKCAVKMGIAHESLWTYDDGPTKFTQEPPPEVYTDALLNQALTYEAVNVDAYSVRYALAQDLPVVFGITLYESFDHVGSDGVVPVPNVRREQIIGGHCMVIVGYGQKPKHFTVRNSWSDQWGDKGDCYMHESYIANPAYASDFWIIRLVEGFSSSEAAQKLQAWIDNPTAGA